MREEVYDIGGMHCASCSSAVERITRKLPGVESSDVNLSLSRLAIIYDEGIIAPEDIISKIERAGFSAKIHKFKEDLSTSPPNESQTETSCNMLSGSNEENLLRERKSLIISAIFAGILFFVSMGPMIIPNFSLPDIFSLDTHPVNTAILQMVLAIPVLFLGRNFFIRGFYSMFRGNPNMDTLVALSASASFIYSLVTTFLITDNPHLVHNLYYESAAVVVVLVSIGKYMEASSKEKTKSAIVKLIKLAPEKAVLVDENGQREVPSSSIKVGDTVLVKPGTRVPCDGIVTSGSGSINEAMITGESMPVLKSEGSEVIGGSLNVDGSFYAKVTRIGEDTTLSQIIRFVEDAQGKKAPISRIADKVSGVFVPIVMTIAIVSALIWLIVGKNIAFAIKVFTSVLVIACPCAMGLATPTAIIVGTGLGASKGILVRSGEALETAHKVEVVIFDKTGTVTEGNPVVTDIVSQNKEVLMQTVYSLESLSEHPLAKAVCSASENMGISEAEMLLGFENIGGRGILGFNAHGHRLLAGSSQFMEEMDINISKYVKDIEMLQGVGKTVICAAVDSELLGIIGVSDKIRENSRSSIERIKSMGLKTVILTGDNRAVAEYVGSIVDVDEVVADVLPTEKAGVVKHYQNNGKVVMMVGDGINDAPALVQADVGCAIGDGSDIAIDSADIILMRSDLEDVAKAIKLSRLTIRNIKQNLFWAFFYNILGIPIAAGVLYPSFGILLSPMFCAFAMSLSSLFVVMNALRLKSKKI